MSGKRTFNEFHYLRKGAYLKTKQGYQVKVLEYKNCREVLIEFQDEYKWQTWAEWCNVTKGTVKNPFHKMIYGVGYLGIMSNGDKPLTTKQNARAYHIWNDMIRRCYSGNYSTYENVEVCERWHSFALFLEDLPKIKNYELWLQNENERVSLNKDLFYTENGLEHTNKIYSLETCQFLTNVENAKEVHDRKLCQE